MADNQSEFSSTGSTETKITSISQDVIQLTSAPVKFLVFYAFLPQTIANFMLLLGDMLELSFSVKYMGDKYIYEIFLLQVCAKLLVQKLPASISNATNFYVQRCLAKSQVIFAQNYIAHYYVIAFFLFILITILSNVFYQKIVSNEFKWFVFCKFTIGSFASLYGTSLYCFFQTENRSFFIFVQTVLIQLIYVTFLGIIYMNNNFLATSITCAGIAFAIAQIISIVWTQIVMFRIPFYNIEYKGTLKISFKRMSPHAKQILVILAKSIQNYFIEFYDVVVLFSLILNQHITVQENFRQLQVIKLVVFKYISQTILCFHNALCNTLNSLVQFNMQNKKISRIFEIIIWAFVIDIVVTIPFAVISLAYAPYFHKFIIPISNNKLKDKIFANLLSKTKKTSYAACWQYVTGDGFGFSVALLGQEDIQWISCLIQLLFLILVFTFLWYASYNNGDDAPYVYVLAESTLFISVIGWIINSYFVVKYYLLRKMNLSSRSSTDETTRSLHQDEMTSKLRDSVVFNLSVAKEEEQYNMDEQRKKRINIIFDKKVALKNSAIFGELRQSYLNTEVQPETKENNQTWLLNRNSSHMSNTTCSNVQSQILKNDTQQ